MKTNLSGKLVAAFNCMLHHYDEAKYWKRREYVVQSHGNKLRKLFYLYYIKRCDAFNNASMGTDFCDGAVFASPPHLPHGLNGIIISRFAKFGSGCKIYHQVTVATKQINDTFVSATIGDNCTLGAKCTILGGVTIGNNVKIGANAVVTQDVPDNCTAVGVPAKIIKRSENDAD